MPWFLPIPESWKKRACRYLLQRYVGHFLKEKLSLDQLSVDLFSGRGVIKDLNLDVEALNDSLDKVNAPIEIIDGYISTISMAIPWSCLLSESMEIEIKGLEITIQLKQCDDTDAFLNTVSMFSSMTSSLQLAEEVINSDKSASDATPESEPFEGVQIFAQTIESVLSRVKLSFSDTIIRLEHVNNDTEKGIALELRIERIDYFDDLANEQGSPVDDCEATNLKLPAEAFKNLHLMGVSLYCDEFSRTVQKTPTMEDSLEISPRLYQSAVSDVSSSTESMQQHVSFQPQSTASTETLVTNNQPIKIAVFTGKQVLKVKVKQNDSLSGPKMDVDCQIGAIHILLSPWQVHGLLYMLNNIDTQGSSKRNSKKKSARDKLMSSTDYQVVEHELQKQLQTTRLHQPLPEPNLNYFTQSDNLLDDSNDESEEIYFSTYGTKKSGLSEMETSTSSIKTDTTMRTNSTATTYQPSESSQPIRKKSVPKSPRDNLQKYADDPTAEMSHYRMKITFVSACILHENQCASSQDVFTPALSASDKLRQISDKFFQAVSRIAFAGVNVSLKELRDQFSKILPHDHLGFLGKPFTVDCTQKVAPRHKTLSVDFVIGMAELVECLFDRKVSGSSLLDDEQPKLATYCELLTFTQNDVKPASFFSSSLHDTIPAVKLHFLSGEKTKSSTSSSQSDSKSKINGEFGQLQCEVDITLIDRLSTLLNNDTYSGPESKSTSNLYNDYNQPYNSMLFNEAIMDEVPTNKLDVTLTSQSATLCIRFPKPDLRSSTERLPWWQRNLHKEILILQLRNFKFLTQVNSGSNESSKLEFTCSDISAFFQEDCTPILIACITSDDTCDNSEKDEGFNWPRLVITSHQISSALQQDQHGDSSDSTPQDSLNGACQFAKTDPSPFSTKKFMFQQEDLTSISHPEPKHTCEELVLPGNEEELKQFREKESSNTKLLVEIVLPNVVGVLHSKRFFELLYNRVNNDLLLWEPMAPSPINTQEKIHHVSQGYNLNVLSPHNASDLFQMAQSGLHYNSDSDSDDESLNYYSIRENKHKKQTSHSPSLQSKMCLSLNISHGKLLANIAHQNDEKKHGELLAVIDDTVLFSVVCHNGDPYLRYLCFQANKIDLCHNGSLTDPSLSGEGALDSLRSEQTRSLHPCIRRSVRGIPSKLAGQVGVGTDSKDMLTVAVKSKLDTINNVKDYTVSVCVKGGTLHHRMSESSESWITQALDLLDLQDYPILGYTVPKVVTQLHLHLWSCSIDYRPLYLPLRSMLTADTFSISSNIVTGSQTSLLRFQLDDAALYLSDKQYMEVNIKDEYVCVGDLERLELSLKTSDGKNQKYPKTDLRIHTNRINIRTCSDSCSALAELIQYFATDGDLQPQHQSPDHHDDSYATSNTDEESYRDEDSISLTSDVSESSSIPSDNTSKMTESCIQQVNTMMADAMRESSPSTSGSESPEREKGRREIFFVSEGNEGTRQYGLSGLREIVTSPSSDSMSSSMYSDKTEKFSDDEEFCIIDDAGWGIAPKDGEPAVRKLTTEPIVIVENYIAPPIGKTDLLKQPDDFPTPDSRYTLKELTVVWYMYGGKDFGMANRAKGRERRTSGDSPKPKRFNLPDFGKSLSKEEIPVIKKPSWQVRGGPGRDCDTLMELQLSKVRFQYDIYPQHTVQAARQVLIIHEVEIRDRLSSSSINKFLYQYTSESLPRQTHANMVLIKAIHTRPDPNLHSQECALKVSLLPLRLNIDQDSLFFLRTFFMELSGEKPSNPYEVSANSDQKQVNVPKGVSPPTPAPVMGVNKTQEDGPEPDEIMNELIKFDEMTLEQDEALQAKLSEELSDVGETESQPVFIKTFIFSPDVHIKLDYHGKRLDMQQGTLAGLLAGLAQLNSSELKLRRLNYKHGLLGMDKVLAYTAHEWLTDIRRNQLPSILGGVGPMHSFVQIVHGIKDLFWLPVEQYKKDGRIVRGIQRGASSFTTSTAMALLELTNKLVLSIQYVAELTYDMLSPGPSVRQPKLKHKKFMNHRVRKGQPSDLREGVNNAYIVIKEGFGDAANNLVRAATEEQEQKGLTGVVGGVLRQIPPTIVKPVIIASEATSKVLGGMRNQLRPESKKEDEEKWKGDEK